MEEQKEEFTFGYNNILAILDKLPEEEKVSLLAKLKVSEVCVMLNTPGSVVKYCNDVENELLVWVRVLDALKRLDSAKCDFGQEDA